MGLIDTVKDFRQFRRDRGEFERILTHALQRTHYDFVGETRPVSIPEEIRSAYFTLFRRAVEKKSIHHGVWGDLAFLDSASMISFYGRDSRGANFVLKYLPEGVKLEISSLSFSNQYDGGEVREMGLISTHLNENGRPQTDLRVGDTFKYHSGYNANHAISNVMEGVQISSTIPNIPEEQWAEVTGDGLMNLWAREHLKFNPCLSD